MCGTPFDTPVVVNEVAVDTGSAYDNQELPLFIEYSMM